MSQRDYAILWVGATKANGGAIASGGSVLLATPRHKLDGPEHQVADDTTNLDASTTQHGLLPKLSGDATDALLGDGTWGPAGTPNAELNIAGGQSVIFAHGSMGSTETFDPTDGNVHTGTLNANCTFTLTAPTGSGACTLELRLTQDGTGGRTITWPGSVTIIGTLDTTLSTQSIVILETLDGGTSWVAVVVGGASSSLTVKDEGGSLATATTSIDFVGAGVAASGTGAAKTVTIPGTPTGAAGGDLSGTYPNPSVVDDSHSHTAATLPATTSGGASEHAHVVEETHLSDGSTVTWTLDQAYEPGSVIAWNTTTIARLSVTEVLPDKATVSAAGSSGDKIVFDYAATLA